MEMVDIFKIGTISSTHGVRGEVKVFPTTDDAKRFSRLKEVLLGDEKNTRIVNVESVKYFKNMVIVKFKEFDSLNDVECLKGKDIFVTRENAVKLEKNEYFIADLIGSKCTDEKRNISGVLEDVMPTGANDVYVIKLEDSRELLLPAIKECILEVDVDSKEMKINILEGLLD